jgi:LytS/YehU family sensor histidine kinase
MYKVLSDIAGVLLQRLVLGQNSGNFSDIIQRWNSIFLDIPASFIFYWGIIILLLGLDYYRKFVHEHTRYLEMESQLSRAQLKSLKMQLNPHFLFNAFNTISMMIRQEKGESAVKMISGLSDMLRHSLVAEPKQFVSLNEEVDLLKKYLLLESERYKDRLVIEWDLDETLMMNQVPSLILQPIVENAFKHGISKNMGKSLLKISIKKENQSLILKVFNTGSYLPINWNINKNKGLGLANTINRLIKLYQKDYKIQIFEKDQGVAVVVRIPIFNKLNPENSIDDDQ